MASRLPQRHSARLGIIHESYSSKYREGEATRPHPHASHPHSLPFAPAVARLPLPLPAFLLSVADRWSVLTYQPQILASGACGHEKRLRDAAIREPPIPQKINRLDANLFFREVRQNVRDFVVCKGEAEGAYSRM